MVTCCLLLLLLLGRWGSNGFARRLDQVLYRSNVPDEEYPMRRLFFHNVSNGAVQVQVGYVQRCIRTMNNEHDLFTLIGCTVIGKVMTGGHSLFQDRTLF